MHHLFVWNTMTFGERFVVETWAHQSPDLYEWRATGPPDERFVSSMTGATAFLHLRTERLPDPAAYRTRIADVARPIDQEIAAERRRTEERLNRAKSRWLDWLVRP